MSVEDGGPAFGEFQRVGNCSVKVGGMTLRDYFAAKAMQALLTRMTSGPGNPAAAERMTRESAEYGYATADAMLAERVK